MTDQSSCSVDSEELSAFMDEELPDQRMTALREHVRECASCTERLSRLRETQRVSRLADAPDAPDSFVSDVRERIDRETGSDAGSGEHSDTHRTSETSSGGSSTTEDPVSLFPSPVSRAAAAVLLVGLSVGLLVFFWPVSQGPDRARDVQMAELEEPTDAESSQEASDNLQERSEKDVKEGKEPASSSGTSAGQGASGTELATPEGNRTSEQEAKPRAEREALDKQLAEKSRSVQKKSLDRSAETGDVPSGNNKNGFGGRPLYVRLTGDLADLPDHLASALDAMDPEHVTARVSRTDHGPDQQASKDSTGGFMNRPQLALDAGVKQLSQILNSSARLELVMPETEAMLFLGALVQQGRSPRIRAADDVRSPETSTVADADAPKADSSAPVESQSEHETKGEKGKDSFEDRSEENMMGSLQRVNVQLQASRSAWVQEQKTADAGSAATDGSISIPALRRFLDDYREDEDRATASAADRAEEQAGSGGETDAAARRVVLQEWIHLLERRPSSWSATAEQQMDQTLSGGRSLEQEPSRDVPDHVDVILYVQPSGEPVEQAAPSTLQQQEDE
jgi:hypothetical protein